MHQIARIKFKNCIFLAFEGAISIQTPIFLFNDQNFIVPARVWKKEQGGRNSSDVSQYFIIKEKWIFSKILPKGRMHQISQIEYENCIFSTFEEDIPPQTPPFSLQEPKIFYNSDKGIKTGKVERIDMKIANIFYWK